MFWYMINLHVARKPELSRFYYSQVYNCKCTKDISIVSFQTLYTWQILQLKNSIVIANELKL